MARARAATAVRVRVRQDGSKIRPPCDPAPGTLPLADESL
jgi:hypothetical protein